MGDDLPPSDSLEANERAARQETGTVLDFGDGVRAEVGEPFCLDGGEWICMAKLVGREDAQAVTSTMFLAQGHGRTAEAAVEDALGQIEQVRVSPNPHIRQRSSIPPAPLRAGRAAGTGPQASAGANTVPPARMDVELPVGPNGMNWLTRLFRR